MQIRRGKSDDLARLMDIERLGTEKYYRAGFPPEEFLPRTEEDLRFLLYHTYLDVAVVEEDLPIGYISYYLIGPYLHLEEHVIHQDWQRQGFGRRLLQHFLLVGERLECLHYSLFTYREADWAWSLYSQQGFRPVELWQMEMLEEDTFKHILTSEKRQKYSHNRSLLVLERG